MKHFFEMLFVTFLVRNIVERDVKLIFVMYMLNYT